ncbi:hypothetical protein OB955_23500 [Halobacteria archaeon AArc-m2/3/4]|uniref:DUF7998 domain-containing protein n=1 Tax=Natronoglomus mannanivorans TaxID=2979990 RepID=A0AAP3E1S4_9EURY|nr:hypothetical protein [Halobacteria archaeon AArc-xg1-1]MCU4975656.1 hypothetical protein [Halobacteria archaeon AArc-m2/3/4]
MNPFARSRSDSDDTAGGYFDDWDEFVAEHNPDPGPFLEGHDLLTGDDHIAFHERTRELFERRGVYDVTFGYNLAKLNLDRRHPDAGYRYAVDADDASVLRAEFTPTTPFCPQAGTLTKGSFRAWNGLADDHEYEVVRVRVHPMHYQSGPLESTLAELEDSFCEAGTLEDPEGQSSPEHGLLDEPTREPPI